MSWLGFGAGSQEPMGKDMASAICSAARLSDGDRRDPLVPGLCTLATQTHDLQKQPASGQLAGAENLKAHCHHEIGG